MAEHYIEEYLVGLGFKLDSKEFKLYEKHLDELEKRQKKQTATSKEGNEQDKKDKVARKTKLDDGKKELDLLKGMETTGRSLGKVLADIAKGNPFGALLSGGQAAGGFINFLKSLGGATDLKVGSSSFKNPFQDPKTAEANKPPESPKPSPHTGGSMPPVAKVGKGAPTGAAAGEDAALVDGAAGGAGAGGAGALAGAGAAIGVAAIVVAVIALMAALAVKTEQVGQALADVNTNIETMSRKLWISDSAAWKLQMTLTAMGKSVSDLGDIALNPVLHKQFEELQAYQEKMLTLPANFKQQNEDWSNSVGTANMKLKETLGYTALLAGSKIQEKLAKPFADLFNTLTNIVLVMDHLLGLTPPAGSTTGLGKGLNGTTAVTGQNGAALFAPQSSSYSSSSASTVFNNNPHIEVHTAATDAQGTAAAVGAALGSSLNHAALMQSVQGQNR